MLTVMTLDVPSLQEGIWSLKPAQACCSLQTYFASCLVCWAEPHICSHPMLVGLTQGDIHTLLLNSGRNMYTTTDQLYY